jgi:hypothetical protein
MRGSRTTTHRSAASPPLAASYKSVSATGGVRPSGERTVAHPRTDYDGVMPEVPDLGGRALKKLELRGRGRERGLAFDDAGANATQCAPGTIRGELALSISDNVVQATDSQESAEREVPVWLADVELV